MESSRLRILLMKTMKTQSQNRVKLPRIGRRKIRVRIKIRMTNLKLKMISNLKVNSQVSKMELRSQVPRRKRKMIKK